MSVVPSMSWSTNRSPLTFSPRGEHEVRRAKAVHLGAGKGDHVNGGERHPSGRPSQFQLQFLLVPGSNFNPQT